MRGGESNTLPSPLNFATPVVGQGPSFLREDSNASKDSKGASTTSGGGGEHKRKTPEADGARDGRGDDAKGGDPKRVKKN